MNRSNVPKQPTIPPMPFAKLFLIDGFAQEQKGEPMDDLVLIDRIQVIDAIMSVKRTDSLQRVAMLIMDLPYAEPLTDIEQRIFLAAMRKEEEVCRKVDKEIDGDVNLTKVCKEIERKVKGALWT